MMPVSAGKTATRLLLIGLLPVFGVQSEGVNSTGLPSMDFLEYLGGVENEIDGELSSPVDLDLEAALVANNFDSKPADGKDAVSQSDAEAGGVSRIEERIDE